MKRKQLTTMITGNTAALKSKKPRGEFRASRAWLRALGTHLIAHGMSPWR